MSPLRYDPAIEQPRPGEHETHRTLGDTMRSIMDTTWQDYGHAVRPVHAKSHAILEGEMEVLPDLPPELAQGIFARPARFPVVMRISTNPGDVMDDDISAPRGLALKVIGVEGERLPGAQGGAVQDFVMANAPAFAAPDAEGFVGNLSMLAATTDTGQAWKKAFSAALRVAEGALEAVGGKSPTLTTLGGQPMTHPLGETFYTMVPLRYGEHVAKLSVAPASPQLKALKDEAVELSGRPNGLREACIRFFERHDAVWEVRAQLRTNPDTMPIEDASVEWPEAESAYRPVARITVRRQPAWSEARAWEVDDGLGFAPWNGIEAHRPLGSLNRARRDAYREAAELRGARNGCPMHQPRGAMRLSDAPAQVYGTAVGREGRRPGTPDALPGHWGQPVNESVRHIVAGAAGGLAAGLLVSAILKGMDAATGETPELVRLQRRTEDRLGMAHPPVEAPATVGEDLAGHAGHLALSAIAGAAYGMARGGEGGVRSGLLFGLGFHALAYGVVGPALGVTPKPWQDNARNMATHAAVHAIFGIATAMVTRGVARRI